MIRQIFLDLEPIISNDFLETHVIQNVNIHTKEYEKINVTFSLAGDLHHTFFDVEEVGSKLFHNETNFTQRIHNFHLYKYSKEISVNFGLKGVFDGTKIKVILEVEPSYQITLKRTKDETMGIFLYLMLTFFMYYFYFIKTIKHYTCDRLCTYFGK